jgi:predicted DNA-binding protein
MPREMNQQSIYLEPQKAERLTELARQTRIPKAVLLREAVDLLLANHEDARRNGRGKRK